MRAVGLLVHGGPEVLQVVQVPEVQAGPGQVRIHVHAAAVNPTDTMARNGSRAEQQKVDPPPYVPGMDAAGIVDQAGIEELDAEVRDEMSEVARFANDSPLPKAENAMTNVWPQYRA